MLCAGLRYAALGKDCTAALSSMLRPPGGTAWFAAAETYMGVAGLLGKG